MSIITKELTASIKWDCQRSVVPGGQLSEFYDPGKCCSVYEVHRGYVITLHGAVLCFVVLCCVVLCCVVLLCYVVLYYVCYIL